MLKESTDRHLYFFKKPIRMDGSYKFKFKFQYILWMDERKKKYESIRNLSRCGFFLYFILLSSLYIIVLLKSQNVIIII